MFKEKPTTLGINPDKTKVENTGNEATQELERLRSEYEEKAKFLKWLWSLRESSEKVAGLLRTPESEAARDQFLDYQQNKELEMIAWLHEHNLKTTEIPNPSYKGAIYEPPNLPSVDRIE